MQNESLCPTEQGVDVPLCVYTLQSIHGQASAWLECIGISHDNIAKYCSFLECNGIMFSMNMLGNANKIPRQSARQPARPSMR